jgi:hypothetical protein
MLLVLIVLPWTVKATDISIHWTDTLTINDTGQACTTSNNTSRYPILGYPEKPYLYLYPQWFLGKSDSVQVNRGLTFDLLIETSIDDSVWTVFDSIEVDKGTNDSMIVITDRIKLDSAVASIRRANYVRFRVVKFCTYLGADTLLLNEKYRQEIQLWLTGRY